jgi:peptidase A4-like protein
LPAILRSSFYLLTGDWVVPTAQQAFGTCNAAGDYSSSWIGIDGWGSNDVLQAGTASNVYCSGSTATPEYHAWYEWYPYSQV